MKAMPHVNFHRADRDLARCSVEWTILGLKVGQGSFMSLTSTVANSHAAELLLKRGKSYGIDGYRAERRSLFGLLIDL
jgi:hypothetical protein